MRILLIAVASVILFFPAFWLFNAVVGPDWGAGIAAVAMYIAFPVIALKVWGSNRESAYPSMEQALAVGDLASVEYSVFDAVEIEELEDEGKHFYLAIAPEKTLFLSGQYLYEPIERKIFPNTHIRIHFNKRGDFTYGIECLGQPLLTVKSLPPFSEEAFQNNIILNDRQIIEKSISEVEANAVRCNDFCRVQ